MEIPVKNVIKKMTPFKLWCKTNFPFIEADFDALTNYEIMCQMSEYLNKMGENVNLLDDDFNTLYNKMVEVINFFNTLDVQEEINNKLDSMVEDGTLERLLNNSVITKSVYRGKLYMNKKGRMNHTAEMNSGYVGGQAGICIGDDIYIYPLIKNNSTGDAKLFKLDMKTGNILDTSEVTGLFHANGCCQKGSSIYFTQTYDDNRLNKYGIVEVDIQTLEVVTIHDVDFGDYTQYQILGIGYDSINNNFYLIGYDYFYICDDDFNVLLIKRFEHPNNYSRTLRQGGSFYDGFVCYITNSENAICCFDTNGKLHHVIEIGQNQESNVFGEIENFSVVNNKLYINSNVNHVSNTNLFLVQFFDADLGSGGLSQVNSNTTFFGLETNIDIIVNKTVHTGLSNYDKFTCDGTNAKPYETLGEALIYQNNNYTTTINITDNNTDYNETIGIYSKNVTIKGGNAKVRSIKVVNSRVTISSLIINHSDERSYMFGNTSLKYNTPLYATYNSEVTLIGNCGIVYNNCVEDGMVNRYVLEGSILNDYSSQNTDYGTRTLTNKDATDYEYVPLLLYGSQVNANRTYGIKNDVSRVTNYKDLQPRADTSTVTLTDLPPFTNIYKGLSVAFHFPGVGNSDFHKLSYYNASRNIIFESLNARYMIATNLNVSNNTLTFTPYKWNPSTNTFQRDTTTQYSPYYEFDI